VSSALGSRSDWLVGGAGLVAAVYIGFATLPRTTAHLDVGVRLGPEQLTLDVAVTAPWWRPWNVPVWAPGERAARPLAVRGAVSRDEKEGQALLARPGTVLEIDLAHENGHPRGPIRAAFLDPGSDRACLPVSFLGLPRGTEERVEIHGRNGAWLLRDLLVTGRGWIRRPGTVEVLADPSSEEHIDPAAGWIERGLASLQRWGVPVPAESPVVILLPKGQHEIATDLGLEERELYVLETGDRGLLVSTLFRDLARAACRRIADARPDTERMIWESLSSVLSLRIAAEHGLEGASEALVALETRYMLRPREASLAGVPESDEERRRMATLDGPIFWLELLRGWPGSTDPLPRLLATALSAPGDLGLREIMQRHFGREAAERVADHLFCERVAIVSHAEQPPLRARAASSGVSRPRGDLTVLFTGVNAGYLDNCGCAVSQLGGLSRRVAAVAEVRRERGEILLLELGDALAGRGDGARRSASEQRAVLDVLASAGYDALVPGAKELSLADPGWSEHARRLGLPLVAANVRSRRPGLPPFERWHLTRKSGLRIAVIGLVEIPYGREWFEAMDRSVHDRYELEDAHGALQRTLADRPEVDLCIVAGSITPRTAARILASDGARVGVLLSSIHQLAWTSHSDDRHLRLQTRAHPGMVGGSGYGLAELERYGLGRVDVELGEELWCAFSALPLGPHLAEDPRTRSRLEELARTLAGRPETWKPTPLTVLAREQDPRARYVGRDRCEVCHPDAAALWKSTHHAQAFATLAAVGREWDPACLRCHTTGFLLPGGFRPDSSMDGRSSLEDVGCEACHGPGHAHAEGRESGAVGAPRRQGWERICVACHDRENSPGFELDRALASVCVTGARRTDPRGATPRPRDHE